MKYLFLTSMLAAGLLIGSSSIAQAQNLWTQERTTSGSGAHPTDGKTITLSGCLDRGAGANEYSIRAATASSEELRSDSINLGAYLYKTVMVVGLQSDNPNAPLEVIYLRLVSNACDSW